MKDRCVCGCGRRGTASHHVLYQQELRRRVASERDPLLRALRLKRLVADKRNLVRVAQRCHRAHHDALERLRLSVLPDSVFEFGLELMSAGELYEYLSRRYDGRDPRLDALLEAA